MAAVANGKTTEFTLSGSTPVLLSNAISPNSKRHMTMLFNKDSAAQVWFAFGSGGTLAPTQGIPVPPGGNAIFGAYDADKLPPGDVWAIATANTTPVISWTDFWT